MSPTVYKATQANRKKLHQRRIGPRRAVPWAISVTDKDTIGTLLGLLYMFIRIVCFCYVAGTVAGVLHRAQLWDIFGRVGMGMGPNLRIPVPDPMSRTQQSGHWDTTLSIDLQNVEFLTTSFSM